MGPFTISFAGKGINSITVSSAKDLVLQIKKYIGALQSQQIKKIGQINLEAKSGKYILDGKPIFLSSRNF